MTTRSVVCMLMGFWATQMCINCETQFRLKVLESHQVRK